MARTRGAAVNRGNTPDHAAISLDRGWTTKQKLGARLRACGYSQQQTADKVGVELTTVQRWEEKLEFQDYVDQLFFTGWQRIEPGIMANVQLSLDVQAAMLRGEIDPSDPRYREAKRIVERVFDRLISISSPPVDTADAMGPATPPPALAAPAEVIEADPVGD